MKTKLFVLALTIAGLAIPIDIARALMVAPPPGPVRIVNSDAVFVGRVAEIEPIEVNAKPYPGAKEMVKYKIALVKVNEVIRGLKTEKSIRVGFVVPIAPKPGRPIIGGGNRSPQLTVGQEGLFMINMHTDGGFYAAPNFGYFVPKQDKNLDKEIKIAKQVVKILADTKTALKSTDADDRLLAASIVVAKYRTQKAPFPNKEEPIDAEESKLILNAIAGAKWGPVRFGEANPLQLFYELGINEKDGWIPPKKINGPDEMRNAVQVWIRDHGDYRIKRFVSSSER